MGIMYVLSCKTESDGGGIYAVNLDSDGKINIINRFSCDRPMYAVSDGKNLHVVLRQTFGNHGGYTVVSKDFSSSCKTLDTLGIVPCHLCFDGENSYIVNYLSGNIVKNCSEILVREGKSINAKRQEMPHTHFVSDMGDGYIGVCDLGTDSIAFYDKNLVLKSETTVPCGYGVRHMVSDGRGKIYAVCELVPAICGFEYRDGTAKSVSVTEIACDNPNASGAAIRISDDGKFLYASLREENAICTFDLSGKTPLEIQRVSCGGNGPRDFNIFGDFVVCCNEKSNNVTVFRITDGIIGEKTDEIYIDAPLCVL